mgnify:CR=1 FL=1
MKIFLPDKLITHEANLITIILKNGSKLSITGDDEHITVFLLPSKDLIIMPKSHNVIQIESRGQ